MIEIISHGCIGDRRRMFKCHACGCVFCAGPMEYEIIYNGERRMLCSILSSDREEDAPRENAGVATCRCPECSCTAEEMNVNS